MASTSPPHLTSHAHPPESTPQRNLDDDDLDPAAFLKSVRELSEKREREDNERFRKLEEEVEKGRQERLARRAEYARSISPEKRVGSTALSDRASTRAPPSRGSIDVNTASPRPSTPSSVIVTREQTPLSSSQSPPGVTDVPEFKGFGSGRKASNPTSPNPQMSTRTPTMSPPTSPVPASKQSPSAAMPSRSGTMKWQQRPQSRAGASRPLSVVAVENNAQFQSQTPPNVEQPAGEPTETSRQNIAAALGSKDPSWFRQTDDRGVGNAAFRKSKDEVTPATRTMSGPRQGLPGMADTASETSSRPSSSNSTLPFRSGASSTSVGNSGSRQSSADVWTGGSQNESRTASTISESTTSSTIPSRSSTSTVALVQARLNRGSSRSPSPTKEMGGFVQSAMLKRSDSINKRSSTQITPALGRADSIRSGYGGLQGSHSMPKLDQPVDTQDTTDSLARPMSSFDLTKTTSSATPSHGYGSAHSRTRSITSAYTTNTNDLNTSAPSSPSKRWSPNKSSWIESALTAKQDSRPPSPSKNSQPAWMANLAKAKAERGNADTPGKQPSVDMKETPQPNSLDDKRQTTDIKQTPMEVKQRAANVGQKPVNTKQEAVDRKSESTDIESSVVTQHPHEESSLISQDKFTIPATTPKIDAEVLEPETSIKRSETAPLASSSAQTAVDEDEATNQLSKTKSATEAAPKVRPQVSPKPQIDFRSTLKSRAPAVAKPQEQPEFLSRFGSLRKTTTEKYVAPDLLKNNILRGKAALAVTDGPKKTERRDELKESLQAKKEEWRREKEEGIVHEHKSTKPPATPVKPEALAKREILGRTSTVKMPSSPEKEKPETPEALRRHQSIKARPVVQPPAAAAKPADEATAPRDKQTDVQDSKVASGFDSKLAQLLARGPPAEPKHKTRPTALGDTPQTVTRESDESPAANGPLQDMRKGRAKGPRRRNAPAANENGVRNGRNDEQHIEVAQSTTVADPVASTSKPKSTASVMMASLSSRVDHTPPPTPPMKSTLRSWPLPSPERPEPLSVQETNAVSVPQQSERGSPTRDIPTFGGFGKSATAEAQDHKDDNKENRSSDLSFLPSVRNATAVWLQKPEERSTERPAPIMLPSKKDEEAAMRSAGLLASFSPTNRNSPKLKSANNVPPKPTKSSRTVSGQLQEASPNQVIHVRQPGSAAHTALIDFLGFVPEHIPQHNVDMPAMLADPATLDQGRRTLKRIVYEVNSDGTLSRLGGADEYILHECHVNIVQHHFVTRTGQQKSELYLWQGSSALEIDVHHGQRQVKTIARSSRTPHVCFVQQGHETSNFLQALGGIFVSRRGQRWTKARTFMLCGRKHLGHIVFDEIDYEARSLCSAFVYLVSSAITHNKIKLFLWRGAACSTVEHCAARLTATDLFAAENLVEVEEGDESEEFWELFEDSLDVFAEASPALRRKAEAADDFSVSLYKIRAGESRQGLLTSLFTRRPSWGSRSPAPIIPTPKLVANKVSPFLQTDLDADGIHLLDAYTQVYLLVGPRFLSALDEAKRGSFSQTLSLVEDYIRHCIEVMGRREPVATVVFEGIPQDMRFLFRHWDERCGLWGTASFNDSSMLKTSFGSLPLRDVLDVIRSV